MKKFPSISFCFPAGISIISNIFVLMALQGTCNGMVIDKVCPWHCHSDLSGISGTDTLKVTGLGWLFMKSCSSINSASSESIFAFFETGSSSSAGGGSNIGGSSITCGGIGGMKGPPGLGMFGGGIIIPGGGNIGGRTIPITGALGGGKGIGPAGGGIGPVGGGIGPDGGGIGFARGGGIGTLGGGGIGADGGGGIGVIGGGMGGGSCVLTERRGGAGESRGFDDDEVAI